MKQKIKNIIPIIVLLAFSSEILFYIITKTYYSQGSLINYQLRDEHFYGFLALIINIIIWQLSPKYFKYTLGLTLLLGCVNILIFGAFKRNAGLVICGLEIIGQPASILATVVAYILNYKEINHFFIKSENQEELLAKKEKEKTRQIQEIESFKNKFKSYSINDLNEVLTKEHYIETAKIAAQNILNEKCK